MAVDDGYGNQVNTSTIQRNSFQEPEIQFRGLSIGLLLMQVGVMIAYGVQGQYYEEPAPAAISYFTTMALIGIAFLTIVGFGLLLSSYRYGTWLGMASTIIVVAMAIQLSPILQTLWFQVFNTSFKDTPTPTEVGPQVSVFWTYYYKGIVDASFFKMRTSFLSSISILIFLTAVIGRISLGNIIQAASIFHVTWALNYNLLIYMATSYRDFNPGNPHSPLVFDTFGTTYIYLFAAFFGLAYSCLFKVKFPASHFRNDTSRFSLTLSLMGTGFIFALFNFAPFGYLTNTADGSTRSTFSILFSMIGSVIGTYIGSGFFGKVGVKECIVGTISGGVVIGSISPAIYNIGIMIMIGTVTGIISGIYMRTIHKSINKTQVKDAMGLFGPFLIAALIGSTAVICSVLAYAYDHNEQLPVNGNPKVPDNLPGWQLVYTGISAGIGLGGGLLAALFSICGKTEIGLGSNHRYFSHDSGLWVRDKEREQKDIFETHHQLKNKDLA